MKLCEQPFRFPQPPGGALPTSFSNPSRTPLRDLFPIFVSIGVNSWFPIRTPHQHKSAQISTHPHTHFFAVKPQSINNIQNTNTKNTQNHQHNNVTSTPCFPRIATAPRDQKAVRSAAETFRQNPNIKVEQVITELGVGEALVSFLDAEGRPSVVDRALILPPRSQLPPLSVEERKGLLKSAARSIGTQVGRELIRGVLGSLTGSRRRR